MCGIVGYIGTKEKRNFLISGLKELEYRGYDSAGIAVLKDGTSMYGSKGSNGVILINTKRASDMVT